MTRNNLIFTHGAVFSVGLAAAMIANNFRDSRTGGGLSGEPLGERSHAAAERGFSEHEEISPRSRATGNPHLNPSKKDGKSATERLSGIVRITDGFERQRALMDLVDSLGPAEFAGIAEQFRGLDHLDRSRGEYSLILSGWAKADPLAALEYVSQHPHSRSGSSTILSTWAGNDPAAAERWALDHHEGNGSNPYLASVIQGIAGNDLANATRLVQTLPVSRERGEAIDSITRALFLQGTDAAMAFPDSIADPALRGGFVTAIADRMAEKDVNKAASWVASMPQGEIQNRAARTVADALARMDPTAAAAWVGTLRPEARAEAARAVIPVMSSTDIAGTAKWVSGMAGTPNFDSMVEEFVWSCNSRAPEQSAAWIQGVSDPEQQRRLYYRMLGEWAQKDAAAVKQWVASNNVPPDVARRFSR